jgi:NitT/TauT family transport system substrate-binding protein
MFFVAEKLGLLDLSMANIVETHSASVSMRLLASGTVESACLTMDEVLTSREKGIDLVVVAILDFSHGADVVMASPKITSQQDVRGKTIGVESTATGAVMLNSFLQSVRLSPAEITIRYLTVDQHEAAFQSGQVDMLVTYEPVKSRLEQAGLVTLYDSSKNPNQIFDVLVVSRPFTLSHKAQLSHLLRTHFKALNAFYDNTPSILSAISGRMNVSEADVIDIYQGLSMPEVAENVALLGGDKPEIMPKIEQLAKTMVDSELLIRMPELDEIIDPQFIYEAIEL